MVATRKTKVSPEPVSATESADADQETLDNTKGLSRLRSGSTTDIENVRVWPLCFAIAIEKSRRIRPGIMVASSSLLAGVSYHLHESDSELLVRFRSHTFDLSRASLQLTPFFLSIAADRIDFIPIDGFYPRRDRHPVRRGRARPRARHSCPPRRASRPTREPGRTCHASPSTRGCAA